MSHVRKGQLTAIKEWRKHLREWKRPFWKAERKEARLQATEEANEMTKARPPCRAFDLSTLVCAHAVMAGLVPAIHAYLISFVFLQPS